LALVRGYDVIVHEDLRIANNRRTQAAFACTACGHTAHADVNAATNILRAGLALREAAQAA
jgi:putative transposase